MREPRTHDYRVQVWGHAIGVSRSEDGARLLSIYGFGDDIRRGDFILLGANDGKDNLYEVLNIEWRPDPNDMFFADVRFVPRGETDGTS